MLGPRHFYSRYPRPFRGPSTQSEKLLKLLPVGRPRESGCCSVKHCSNAAVQWSLVVWLLQCSAPGLRAADLCSLAPSFSCQQLPVSDARLGPLLLNSSSLWTLVHFSRWPKSTKFNRQNITEQNRTEQNRTEKDRTEQNRRNQNRGSRTHKKHSHNYVL